MFPRSSAATNGTKTAVSYVWNTESAVDYRMLNAEVRVEPRWTNPRMEVSAEVQKKSNMADTSVEFQYPVQLKTLRNELLQSIAVPKVAFEPDKVGHMNPSPEFMQGRLFGVAIVV